MKITLEQTAAELLSRDNITILCHRKPDGDTLGSGYALHYALAQLGKHSAVRCADTPPQNMAAYLADREPGEWQEQYVVAVDIADVKLLGSLEEPYGGRVDLVIDHHPSNSLYGTKTLLRPEAAATAEIMGELLPLLGVKLTSEMANCLYIGIATDTGCFRYANTTAHTLRMAAVMLDSGIDTQEINQVFFETKTAGRIAIECSVLQSVEYFHQGRCAIMTIPMALQAQYGVDDSELDGLSALPRQIEGVWVGITIREQPDCCRVSVRTTKEADASAICAAFGGGGHIRAGGCTILGGIAQARERLAAEVGKHL